MHCLSITWNGLVHFHIAFLLNHRLFPHNNLVFQSMQSEYPPLASLVQRLIYKSRYNLLSPPGGAFQLLLQG